MMCGSVLNLIIVVAMPGFIIGDDVRIASWAHQEFNVFPMPVNLTIGIANNEGNLVGAILFQNFNGVNIEISVYTSHRVLTPNIIRHIARVAVGSFNVGRLTAITSRRNKRLIRSLMKLGFKLEGVQRVFYGLEDCKKNSAVRLVAFRPELEKVAFRTIPEKKPRHVV